MIVFWAWLKAMMMVVIRWAIRLLIAQIIFWMFSHLAAWLIEKYQKEIEKWVTDLNNGIGSDIFNIGKYIPEVLDWIYEFSQWTIDDFIIKIEALFALDGIIFEDALNENLLSIGFVNWIKETAEGLGWELGQTVKVLFEETLVKTMNTLTDTAKNQITSLITHVETLNRTINETVQNAYAALVESIEAKVLIYNSGLNLFLSYAAGLTDIMDICLNKIKTGFNSQVAMIETHYTTVDTDLIAFEQYLLAVIQPGAILTASQVETIAQNAVSIFSNVRITSEEIDVSLCTLPAIQIQEPLAFPTADLNAPNISFLTTKLNDLCLTLGNLQTFLITLPATAKTAFIELIPDILKSTDIETKIKNLVMLSLLFALIAKRKALVEKIDAVKASVQTQRTEVATEIVAKSNAIKAEIVIKQDAMIELLPSLMQPITDEYKAEIEGQVVEIENEIIVNIDKIAPDLLGIDHLIESFPSHIQANKNPNKKDSEFFDINAVFRMLCNYFGRAERIALIIVLIEQDIPNDIEEFFKP
ncbi:hypothetical protein QUF75_02010 [Desulfococcaceae bacterium HSG7]|nr:hypothetical protein [Desulfococcaceae bacterium HSG7]